MNDTNQNGLITEEGLVLKNVAKIEDITTRLERRVEIDTRSWQISRHLRRDFNLIASKIYKITSANKDGRYAVHDLLMEIALQASEFGTQSSEFSEHGEGEVRKLELRLISAESSMLFNALRQVDLSYARTNFAIEQTQLTHRRQGEMAEGFEIAYAGLKKYLFAKQPTKTADELGREMGII